MALKSVQRYMFSCINGIAGNSVGAMGDCRLILYDCCNRWLLLGIIRQMAIIPNTQPVAARFSVCRNDLRSS